MGKIAMCVCTYNHPETVEDVLEHCIKDYYDCGIDIYYYEGSEESSTEEVVERYRNLGYNNLFFLKCPIPINDRIDMQLLREGLEKEYEYIWLCKDRSYVSRNVLERINHATDLKRDVIFLGAIKRNGGRDGLYEDPVEFYRDWAFLVTSLDATILRVDSMIQDYKPGMYPYVFGVHFTLMFLKRAEKKDKKIEVLYNDVRIINSPYSNSMWQSDAFKVWKDEWVEANDLLPDCYSKYKETVIKSLTGLPWILGGYARLIELHNAGLLVPETLDKVRVNWERVSDIPFDEVETIAYGRFDVGRELEMLPVSNVEILELMKKITKALRKDPMGMEYVPIDQIRKLTCDAIGYGPFRGKPEEIMFRRSIDDLCNIVCKHELNSEELANILQTITLFLYASLR